MLTFDEAQGVWIAADAASAAEALAHPRLRVRPLAEAVPKALQATRAGEVFGLLVRMNDGDFHRRHRQRVAANAARFTREQATLAGRMAAADLLGVVDPNEMLARAPVHAMAMLLEVPAGDMDSTVTAVLRFVRCIAPGADAQAIRDGSEAAADLMAQGEAMGLDRVMAANRIALMQQSADATSGLIGLCAMAQRVRPDAAPADIVQQVMRTDPPVRRTRRFAEADMRLCGREVRAGQCVLVDLAAAGIPFGAGVHQCPGEGLAMAIAEGAFPVLAPRLGRVTGWRALANCRIPVFENR